MMQFDNKMLKPEYYSAFKIRLEAFPEAYLCFLVSASAKKMLRQLNNDDDDVFNTILKLDFMT